MEKITESKESQLEKEPHLNKIVADFLRHGETNYLEEFHNTSEPVRDLTPEGEIQVKETAKKIIETIDPEREIIVLWSSPAWRAQGSEELILELLEEKGIPVYKDSTIPQMVNFRKYDKEYFQGLWQIYGATGKSFDAIYAKDPDFQELNEKFETIHEVKRRAEKVFYHIANLAKVAKLDGKTLHIIGVSHFEFLNPIMEEIFGHDVEQGHGVKRGEDIHIEFTYDLDQNKLLVGAVFRGERKDNIEFDMTEKKFIVRT